MLLLKLFPTPVAVFDFKSLSEEETSTIVNTPSGNTKNTYLENVSSNDKNILKNEKLKKLREAIQTCIDRYKNEVMSCDEELYMTNFDLIIGHLLNKIEREEKEKIKNTQRLEYKIGLAILRPFRLIKNILNL